MALIASMVSDILEMVWSLRSRAPVISARARSLRLSSSAISASFRFSSSAISASFRFSSPAISVRVWSLCLSSEREPLVGGHLAHHVLQEKTQLLCDARVLSLSPSTFPAVPQWPHPSVSGYISSWS